MKVLAILCLVALAGCTSVDRECIYDNRGILCVVQEQDITRIMRVEDCPEGTVSYTTGCNRVTPEATCDNQNPVEESFETCDVSECYCKAPTVRDTATNKCVTLDKCPKKELA